MKEFGSDLARHLHRHVDCLAGLIGPRHLGRPESMNAALAFIEREFQEMSYQASRQNYDAGRCVATNVIVERRGETRPDEIVILGAHYDTVPETPGADDNASAVAVLLEVARSLVGTRFQRTVRFVSFACEEPPHFHTDTMGSQFHARHCRMAGEKITGMLCLEMVGYYSSDEGSQAVPSGIPRAFHWLFPKRGDFLTAVGNLRSWRLCWRFRRGFKAATRFPLFSIALPESVHAIRLSDNSSFWDQGYPALMLTDTSFLRNPNYHRPSDTADTLDYERMAQVVQGVSGAVKAIAGECRSRH